MRRLTVMEADRLDREIRAGDLMIEYRRHQMQGSLWLKLATQPKEALLSMAHFFHHAHFNAPLPEDWPTGLETWAPSLSVANLTWAGGLIMLARDNFGLTSAEVLFWDQVKADLADALLEYPSA